MKTIWKKCIIALAAFAASKVSLAGCWPLIPVVYVAAMQNEMRKGILFVCTCLGMILYLPMNDLVKYTVILIVVTVLRSLLERSGHFGKAYVMGILTAGMVVLITIGGSLLLIVDGYAWKIIFLEGVFVFGGIILADKGIFLFLQSQTLKRNSRRNRKERFTPCSYLEREDPVNICAQSVRELSDVFAKKVRAVSREDYGIEKITSEMTGRICISCEQCACCLVEQSHPMQELMQRIVESLKNYGTLEATLEEEVLESCIHAEELIAEALHIMECMRLNESWYHRLVQNQGVVAWQLDAISQMIEQAGNGQEDISLQERSALSEITYRLGNAGIRVQTSRLFQKRDGHLRLIIECRSKNQCCISVKDVVPMLATVLQKDMISHRDNKLTIGKESISLTFEEAPYYRELHGIARLTKQGETVSGDNFSIVNAQEGICNLCLSDGMGSGMSACKESEMVLELVEKFLETGFTQELSIQMMNAMMILQENEEQYSTIDIASVNLYDGCCELYKIGAAPTFIRRSDQVECLVSTNLPVGFLAQPEMEISTLTLKHSDMIVMMTDGVLDNLCTEDPERTMQEIIRTIQTNHPGRAAEEILNRVLEYTQGEIQDDMSVLVAGIWER